MDERIAKKFRALRDAWEPTEDCYVAGMIPANTAQLDPDLYPYIADLAAVSDGPACGVAIFHASNELEKFQFVCDPVEGGTSEWLCIGFLSDQPLLVSRNSGLVVWVDRDTFALNNIAPFDDFLDRWILGDRYIELIRQEDEWFKFTKRVGVR